jgi:hypothetical protein
MGKKKTLPACIDHDHRRGGAKKGAQNAIKIFAAISQGN